MITCKTSKLLAISLFLFCALIPLADVYGCTVPDAAGSITGKSSTCKGLKVTFSVPAIGFATSYKWTFPASTQVITGANADTITVIFWGSSGYIRVQGVNTCDTGVSSSFFVTVNLRPNVSVISPQKYCCDYGNISLGSSAFGSPVGGTWSCRQNSKLISGNVFLTSDACSPLKSGVFTLTYNYQDPSTGCINYDSTRFTINPLPTLQLKGGYYCQDKIEAQLKKHVLAPVNLNSMANVSWKLLKTLPKPGGGNNTITDFVYDKDPTLNYDFWLKVDTATIDLGTKTKDSIILEITIEDYAGCFNRDTATFYIVKVPIITFNTFPELCINAGKVDLTKNSNARPLNGCWKAVNKAGYNDSTNLIPGMVSCDTLNTFLLNAQKSPGLYWMRYAYSSGGCPAMKEMELRINQLPRVVIGLSPNPNTGRYCETDDEVTLNASPAGGNWSCSVAGVIAGNKFKPASVGEVDRDKWIYLTYSYTNKTTKCDTAKSLPVFVQSKPIINILTPDIDTCRRDTLNIKLTAKPYYTSKITWVHSSDLSRVSFENKKQLSNNNPAIITIRTRKDSAMFIRITAFTEADGVCPFAYDTMNIRIDTTQCKDSMVSVRPSRFNKPFEIVLFPNPAKDKLNIEIKKAGVYSLKFYSMEGKLLFEKVLTGFEINTIDQKLPGGIYTVLIADKNGYSTTKKIIVE